MSHSETKRTVLSILFDIIAIVACMATAFWVRFVLFQGENPVGGLRFHILWAGLFSPVYVILYSIFGVYAPKTQNSFVHELGNIVLANTFGTMLYIDLVFVFRVVDFSRWMILINYILLNLLIGVRGYVVHQLLRRRYNRGQDRKTLVIIGDGDAARDCYERICREPYSMYTVIGSIGKAELEGVPRLGGYHELRAVLEKAAPDEAIIALETEQAYQMGALLRMCDNTGVKLAVLPMGYEYMSARPYMEPVAGLPLMNIRRVALDNKGWDFVKRMMDIVGSLLLIILTSPIMLIAVIGTRLSSPGPIIFYQERIGKDRKPFKMMKFRSMRVNDASNTAWTTQGDPRRTKFGAFMRRYSIDELPQFFNVLKGDMSLVGPRPEIPRYVDHFKYSIPLYMVRHQVRPGVTGWAQVNGLRGDTSIQSRVDYDLYYIENWSVFFDIKILLMTPFKGLVNQQETLVK